jgi:sterol desaturase/sphingolipid hydroxylase (fatty acid hydroxylase superfamily)
VSHTVEVSQPLQPYQGSPQYQAVPEEPSLPWGRAIAVTLTVFLLAGVAAGWAWQQFAPLARYTVDGNGGSLGEEEMTRVFGPDATFVVIGFIAGVVLGGLVFWWLHRYGPWSVAVVLVGSAIGSGVAWTVGMLLGHDPLDPRLEAAKPGDLLPAPLELHGWTALSSWVVGAALVTAIIAATTWRNEPATPAVQAAAQPAQPGQPVTGHATAETPAASEQSPWTH